MDAPVPIPRQDRVLTSQEFITVYRESAALGSTGGKVVQLLILIGQRRGEIGALRAEWINSDARTITFPSEITKNGRRHILPYGELVASILEGLPREGFLFPARD